MTDIVERLRWIGTQNGLVPLGGVYREAVKEIEELRAKVGTHVRGYEDQLYGYKGESE